LLWGDDQLGVHDLSIEPLGLPGETTFERADFRPAQCFPSYDRRERSSEPEPDRYHRVDSDGLAI
jgi:hypothetical protein